jgi:hypothetical protein
MDTMWEIPKYDLDKLKLEARARLLAQGDDPKDSLKVYRMVNKLRGEELRRRLPVIETKALVPEERRLPPVPEARSAKETTS